jgi:iron complex outermembrane receptor protein
MISDTESQSRLRPDDPGRPGAIVSACLRRFGPLFALTLASGLALAGEADAAPARFAFHIAAKSRSEALIDLGVQAHVTLGGASSCTGQGKAVVGVMTLRQALDAVTTGGACRFEILDNATVSIRPAPTAARAAKPSPAPSPAAIVQAVDSVIVTATKRPTRLGAAAGGLSVISAARLRDTGAIDTTSISQQTAGFITTNLGAARNKIMLRGLSDGTFTGRTQQTVGTYLDNIPLTYNAPDPDLRLIDVDRVEILRGPQGALYGGGSLSGVYRIVSTKPVAERMVGLGPGSARRPRSPARPAAAPRACSTYRWSPTAPPFGWRPIATWTAAMSTTSTCACPTSTAPRAPAVARPWRWRSIRDWSILVSGARQDLHATDSQYTTPSLGGPRRANQVRETHDNRPAAGGGDDQRGGGLGPVRLGRPAMSRHKLRQPLRRHRSP